MRKTILALLLILFSSSAHAAMLTGQTPASYNLPSGWSLVISQDFEGSLTSNEAMTKTIVSDRYHSGAKSASSSIVGDSNDDSWWLKTNRIGTFNEVYISWYEYMETSARINDEYWLLQFLKRAPDDTMWQEIIVTWLWAGFNSTTSPLFIVPQTEVNDLGATWRFGGSGYTVPTGSWVQWEIHYRPNSNVADPYNDRDSDGFLRVYKDGTLWASAENKSLNGNVDMSNMAITIGGTYTKLTWMSGGSCSTSFGQGTDSGPRVQTFGVGNPCPCENQCPPDGYVPTFKRYFDDILIMKLSGSSGGPDVQPPYITGRSPASGATGIPATERVISYHVVDDRTDDDGVTSASIAMTVEGSTVTPTITGTASNYTVSYTNGSDWSASQVVDVTVTAQDAAGNTLNSAWSFTVAKVAGPDNLAITTTTLPGGKVGTAYSQQLASSGGTAPITYSMNSTPYDPGYPYPPSTVITGVTWDYAGKVQGGAGSDLWPVAWKGDNTLLTAWGDGGGPWAESSNTVCRTRFGMASMDGSPPNFTFTSIWGCKADNTGCYGSATHNAACDAPYGGTIATSGVPDALWADNNTLYVQVAKSGGPQLSKSTDGGQSWTEFSWQFTANTGDFVPDGPVQFGAGNNDSPDSNFYIVGGKVGNTVDTYLARVPKATIDNQSTWEYYTSTDPASPTWGTWANAKAIHTDATNTADGTSTGGKMQYFPVIARYIFTNYAGAISKMHIYESVNPWGPWYTVEYNNSWGNYGISTGLWNNILPKFISADDTEFYVLFSGFSTPVDYDNYNLIKGTFTLAGAESSLPAGLSLSSSGLISGIPTAVGTTSFTVTATDSAPTPQTDDQALSIKINAATPGGQTTVTGTAIEDTWINSGSTGTNYSTGTTTGTYDWPDFTVSNKTILMDNTDIVNLPDNITITSATLRLYLTDGGGYNPTDITVHRITGAVPTISSVTWASFSGTVGPTLDTVSATLVPRWIEFNVLSAVQSAYTSGDPVYLLVQGGTGTADTWRDFASAQHGTTSWVPQLVITYTNLVGPSGPSISAPGKLRVSKLRGRIN